jgi:hypothetical protein
MPEIVCLLQISFSIATFFLLLYSSLLENNSEKTRDNRPKDEGE